MTYIGQCFRMLSSKLLPFINVTNQKQLMPLFIGVTQLTNHTFFQ